MSKTADRLILRPISRDLPGTASTDETSPLENLKSSCFSRHKPRLRKSGPAGRSSNIKTHHTTPSHEEYSTSSSFSSVDVTRPVPTRCRHRLERPARIDTHE